MDPALLPGSIDWDTLLSFATVETNTVESSKDTLFETSPWLYIDPRLLTGEIDFEGLVETQLDQPTAAVEEAYFDQCSQ